MKRWKLILNHLTCLYTIILHAEYLSSLKGVIYVSNLVFNQFNIKIPMSPKRQWELKFKFILHKSLQMPWVEKLRCTKSTTNLTYLWLNLNSKTEFLIPRTKLTACNNVNFTLPSIHHQEGLRRLLEPYASRKRVWVWSHHQFQQVFDCHWRGKQCSTRQKE